jgi:hypothetical protein
VPPSGEGFWYEAGFEPASLDEEENGRAEDLIVLKLELAEA